MSERVGKPVILKQLHNLSTKLHNNTNNTHQNDLQKLADEMQKIPDATVKIAYENETKELIVIFFQDGRMRSIFDKFPEL